MFFSTPCVVLTEVFIEDSRAFVNWDLFRLPSLFLSSFLKWSKLSDCFARTREKIMLKTVKVLNIL